jgi:hypothetical protein
MSDHFLRAGSRKRRRESKERSRERENFPSTQHHPFWFQKAWSPQQEPEAQQTLKINPGLLGWKCSLICISFHTGLPTGVTIVLPFVSHRLHLLLKPFGVQEYFPTANPLHRISSSWLNT